MPNSHFLLRLLRQIHLYVGIFISPMLLFFAFTGALQTFNLHETTQGSSYKPSTFIMTMAQIHKKQTWMLPPSKTRPVQRGTDVKPDGTKPDASKVEKAPAAPPTPAAPQKSHLPMKILFLLVSVGLFMSTLTGIYMAYKFNRSKLLVTGLLLAGIVVPLVLLPY
jgi:hypothetical protein